VTLTVLVARDAITRLPGNLQPSNLPTSKQMLVGATGLALLLTALIAFGAAFRAGGFHHHPGELCMS
jgi:hypothetical protein